MSAELTPAELRRHPVTELLVQAAGGNLPTEADLDELRLPQEPRREVADAAALAAAAKAGGENQEARAIAREAAARIVNALPPEMQDPDYLKEPEPDVTNPADLAAQVSRGW